MQEDAPTGIRDIDASNAGHMMHHEEQVEHQHEMEHSRGGLDDKACENEGKFMTKANESVDKEVRTER